MNGLAGMPLDDHRKGCVIIAADAIGTILTFFLFELVDNPLITRRPLTAITVESLH